MTWKFLLQMHVSEVLVLLTYAPAISIEMTPITFLHLTLIACPFSAALLNQLGYQARPAGLVAGP